MVIAGVMGFIIGTLLFYYLGQKIGKERLAQWTEKHGHWLLISSKDVNRAQEWFDRHGKTAVLLCRLVPGIRTLISIPADINGMNLLTYLLLKFVGTSIWMGMLAYFSQYLGQNYAAVSTYLNPISYVVMGNLFVWDLAHVIKRKQANKN